MSNGDDTFTHKDIAQRLGVSETTVKSYRRKFPLFFPLHSRGKPLRFKPVAMDVALRIREGFLQDLSVEEIRSLLDKEFRHIKADRHTSKPLETPPGFPSDSQATATPPGFESLENTMRHLVREQAKANERLAALHGVMAEFQGRFLQLLEEREDSFAQGMAALQALFRQTLEQAGTTPPHEPERNAPPLEKRVTIRNIYGGRSEYRITSEPTQPNNTEARPGSGAPRTEKHPPEPAPSSDSPLEDLLHNPLVVRSTAGEYLGIAGKSEGMFSLKDFMTLVRRSFEPPHHFGMSWRKGAEGIWSLILEQEAAIRPQNYVLLVESVTTPKGNDVTLLSQLEVSGSDMPPANLYAFIRQMKERLQQEPEQSSNPKDMS